MTSATETRVLPAADLDRRFHAFVIDRFVAWTVVGAVAGTAYHVPISRGGVDAGFLVIVVVLLLVVGLGLAIVQGLTGTSPGKAALRLRVVHVGTGTPIGVLPAVQRSLILGVATLPTLGLGVTTLAWTAVTDPSRMRRGWHDLVTSSVVVDVRPAPEEPAITEAQPRQIVNLTAMRLVPASAAKSAPERTGPRHRDIPALARWRVRFDTGETVVVEGLTLLGRRPEPRPGEQVQQVVPLRSEDMSLSKIHAQLQVAPEGVLVVMDRGSANGSVLIRQGAAKDLPAGKPATLLPGDEVAFGDRRMTVAREP